MEQAEAPSVVTTLSMHIIEKAKVHHGKSDQHSDKKQGYKRNAYMNIYEISYYNLVSK